MKENEIRNSKLEARNTKTEMNSNDQLGKFETVCREGPGALFAGAVCRTLSLSNFGFVSDFDIRISKLKPEARISKQIRMSDEENSKRYDCETPPVRLAAAGVSSIALFEFRICFGFRYSNFEIEPGFRYSCFEIDQTAFGKPAVPNKQLSVQIQNFDYTRPN